MTRKQRARSYDMDPEALTRPDTVPGALRFEDSIPRSVSESRAPRELSPYPRVAELAPPSDEATVAYPALQGIPRAVPHSSEETPAGDAASLPRSGTRRRAPLAFIAPRPVAPQSKKGRVFVFGALSMIAAALFGASLGNGSLVRAAERLYGSHSKPEETSAPVVLPSLSVAASPSPSARPVLKSAPPPAPAVRFEDLPLTDPGSDGASGKRDTAGAGRHSATSAGTKRR